MVNLLGLTQEHIVGLTIAGEARGEPIEGQVAVGCVIRNRIKDKVDASYHDICLARLQFSCWNEDDPNRPLLLELAEQLLSGQKLGDYHLRQCLFIGYGIVNNQIVDNTYGAKNFLTHALFYSKDRPQWARRPTGVARRGNHMFFTV